MGRRLLDRQIIDQVLGSCHIGRESRIVQQQFHIDRLVADSVGFRCYFPELGHSVSVGGGQLHVDAIRQLFRLDTQVFEYTHGLVTHSLDLNTSAGLQRVELGPHRGQLLLSAFAIDTNQGGNLFGQHAICVG